jgi:adenylate kinase
MSAPNWGEFENRSPAREPAEAGRDEKIAETALRAVSNPDGRALMDYLRSITIERHYAPGSPDALLRELEGQRWLVHHVEQLAEAARKAIAESGKNPPR